MLRVSESGGGGGSPAGRWSYETAFTGGKRRAGRNGSSHVPISCLCSCCCRCCHRRRHREAAHLSLPQRVAIGRSKRAWPASDACPSVWTLTWRRRRAAHGARRGGTLAAAGCTATSAVCPARTPLPIGALPPLPQASPPWQQHPLSRRAPPSRKPGWSPRRQHRGRDGGHPTAATAAAVDSTGGDATAATAATRMINVMSHDGTAGCRHPRPDLGGQLRSRRSRGQERG